MGGVDSKKVCKQPLGEDLCPITLSDALVQRIPHNFAEGPSEEEQRRQNIDDYWREHLECLENAYAESISLSDREFRRLEAAIVEMSPGTGKQLCPRAIEDATSCYQTFPEEPLECGDLVKKLQYCLDSAIQEKQEILAKKRAQAKKCPT